MTGIGKVGIDRTDKKSLNTFDTKEIVICVAVATAALGGALWSRRIGVSSFAKGRVFNTNPLNKVKIPDMLNFRITQKGSEIPKTPSVSSIAGKKITASMTAHSIDAKSSYIADYIFSSIPRSQKNAISLTIPPRDPFVKEINVRVVGHQTDHEIRQSTLEGGEGGEMRRHIGHFLKLCKKQGGVISPITIEKIETFFENCEVMPNNLNRFEIQKLADMYMNRIRSLQPKQSISFEGGWINKETIKGHYLIYTFTKQENGNYDIYIYNTGDGVQYHSSQTIQEGLQTDTLICPYVKFQSVPPEKIGISPNIVNSGFFSRLIEISNGHYLSNSAELIYESFLGFGRFYPYLVEPIGETSYVPPQKSGTCTYTVLMARLRSEFASEEEYRKFDFALKYNSLKVLFETIESSGSDVVEIVEKQGEKLSRSLEEIEHLLPKEEVIVIRSHIEHMLQQAASIKSIAPVVPEVVKPAKFSYRVNELIPTKHIRPLLYKGEIDKPITTWNSKDFLIEPLTVHNIQNRLALIEKTYHPDILRYSVEKFSREFFEISSEDLQKIPKEEIPGIIKVVSESCIRYLKIDPFNPLNTQISVNTIFALALQSYNLASLFVPELQRYNLSAKSLEKALSSELLTEYSIKENILTKKLLTACKEEKLKIFNFSDLNFIGEADIPELSFLIENADEPHTIITAKDKLKLFFERNRFASKKGQLIVQLRDLAYMTSLVNSLIGSQHPIPDKAFRIINSEDKFLIRRNDYIYSLKEDTWKRQWGYWDKDWEFLSYNSLEKRKSWGFSLEPTTFLVESEALISPEKTSSANIPPVITANKETRTAKLLYLFSSNWLKLSDSKEQEFFFKYLFQSTDSGPPIFKEKDNTAFLRQLSHFAKTGVSLFSQGSLTGKQDILTSLFFVRLIRRVQDLGVTGGLPSFSKELNNWLSLPNITEEEKKQIHLHRILQYQAINPNLLSQKEIEDIFTSWILCKDVVFTEKMDGKYQKEEASRFICRLASHLSTLPSHSFDNILRDVVKIENLDSKLPWDISQNPVFKKGDLSVNFFTGEIYKEEKPFQVSTYVDLSLVPSYRILFGDKQMAQYKIGNTYEFRDKTTGELFRYIYNFDSVHKDKKEEALQVLFQDRWYQYLSPEEFTEDLISFKAKYLLYNFHCFTSGENYLFLEKESRKIVFSITRDGKCVNVLNGSEVVSIDESQYVGFEKGEWTIIEKNPVTSLLKIRYPRVATPSGRELCLIQDENKRFVLEEYPVGFVLIQPIKHLLGHIEDALFFQNPKTNEIKILAPIQDFQLQDFHFQSKKPFGPVQEISLPSVNKRERYLSEKGVYSFAEYSYKKDKIIPKDSVAKAFLAYICILQKQDVQASILLDGLGRDLPLTKQIEEILYWIVDPKKKSPNQTPARVAISLKAALFLARKEVAVPLHNAILSYQKAYADIPVELRLTKRELQELAILDPSIRKTRSVNKGKGDWNEKKNYDVYGSSFQYSSSIDLFCKIYRPISSLDSFKDRQAFMANLGFDFLDLSKELQAIVVHADRTDKPLPNIPSENVDAIRSWVKDFLPKIGSVSVLPRRLREGVNTDPILSRGTPIRSIETALAEVNIPSPIEQVAVVKKPKELDLQAVFIEPYFRIITRKKDEKVYHLTSPKKVDPIYQDVIARAIKEVNEDIDKGKALSDQVISFIPKTEGSRQELRIALTHQLEGLQKELVQARDEILTIVNLLPSDVNKAEKIRRLKAGRMLKKISLEQLITKYLRGSYDDLNPHLTREVWQSVDEKIGYFLQIATQAQQIERAIGTSSLGEAGQILDQKIAYTPFEDSQSRVFLVYEYRANMRLRPMQVEGLKTLVNNSNVVLQMPMGSGKTAVLTSILLEVIDPNKVPVVIPPPAQFETVVENLHQTQSTYYGKQIIPIRLNREELTLNKLDWIQGKLSDSSIYQEVIISTPTTIQSLQLEWFSLLDKSRLTQDEGKKFTCLTGILQKLRSQGVFILDEVDQILALSQELNFPIGTKEPISRAYIDCILHAVGLHLHPEIEKDLGLLRGSNGAISQEVYKQRILPKLAYLLFETYKEQMHLTQEQKEDFIQYILTEEENSSFCYLLEQRISSKDEKEKVSGQLVFLVKGLFTEILPTVMRKVENKDFGFAKGDLSRKIIPFLGVDSPAITEFASPYITLAYMGLAAIVKPLTAEELYHLAAGFMANSLLSIQYEQKTLEETEEYHKFMELTGSPLDKIYGKDIDVTQETLQRLRDNPKQALELAKEYTSLHLGSYDSYYQSNALNMCALSSCVKGLTGTPWNRIAYLQALKKNVQLQIGTEGRIRDAMLRRAENGITKIHFTPSNNIAKTLEVALKDNPRRRQFRALLDPAGHFNDYSSNEEAAKEILSYFTQDSTVESVLFYKRRSTETSGIPNTLMVLRKVGGGDYTIEEVGGTRLELLEAKSIDPNKTITYYDQKHCEATDIPQIADAFGLVVMNSRLIERDLLQTSLRFRKYLEGQDLDFILPENERQNYPDLITVKDIVVQSVISQAINTADSGFFSYLAQVDDIIRTRAYDLLLQEPSHERMESVRASFVMQQDISPYVLFGLQKERGDPLTALRKYRQERQQFFFHIIDKATEKLLDDLEKDMEENLDCFPKSITKTKEGSEKQVENCIQQQKESKRESEIEIENSHYQKRTGGDPFIEKWLPGSYSPKDLLEQVPRMYLRPYSKLFEDAEFTISENFAFTETALLPVFSAKQKPALQILVKKGFLSTKIELISSAEAANVKKLIENKERGYWLFLPNGEPYIDSVEKLNPQIKKKLERVLLDVNIFNGNIGYLIRHKDLLMSKIGNDSEKKALLFAFLSIKTLKNPVQKSDLEKLHSILDL